MENRIKVVLADANENFRTMLQQTIENTGEFDVVGSAGDGAGGMEDDRTGTSAACNYRRDPAGAGRLRAARPDGKAAGTAEDDPGFRLLPRADGDAGNGAGRGLLHGKALRGRLAARADASGRPERGDGGGKPRRRWNAL